MRKSNKTASVHTNYTTRAFVIVRERASVGITLRRSRVSVAIRPLLGRPRRTSFLSWAFLSTFPFTRAAGEASEQHETVNFTAAGVGDVDEFGKCGIDEHCRKIVRATDISTLSLSKTCQCFTVWVCFVGKSCVCVCEDETPPHTKDDWVRRGVREYSAHFGGDC